MTAALQGGDRRDCRDASHDGNGDDGAAILLKRLRKRGASVALEAANPAYETRIFGPDRVQIQGKLVSLIRRY